MPLEISLYDDGTDFMELVRRCYKEKPDSKDLQALGDHLSKSPELFKQVFNLSAAVRNSLITAIAPKPVMKTALTSNVKNMRGELGYDQAPIIEQMLIDSIVLAWLRYQWVEHQVTELIGSDSTFELSRHWDRKLTEAQRRYLRAVEALARVRKMALPALQVNINTENGQQVNIAGDLVRR